MNQRSTIDLVAALRHSFERFLQFDVAAEKRERIRLQAALRSYFSLESSDRRFTRRTHAAPLKLLVRYVMRNEDNAIVDVKEQKIYFGELPTLNAAFVIDVTWRLVAQRLAKPRAISTLTTDAHKVEKGGRSHQSTIACSSARRGAIEPSVFTRTCSSCVAATKTLTFKTGENMAFIAISPSGVEPGGRSLTSE